MSWRHRSPDNKVEVIVEPDFRGDLMALAKVRVVWIVGTSQNQSSIDAVWAVGADLGLFEVTSSRARDPFDRHGNLLGIMGDLDDHHAGFDMVVHGLNADEPVRSGLEAEGFTIVEVTDDGFIAQQIPGVRDRLLGRA